MNVIFFKSVCDEVTKETAYFNMKGSCFIRKVVIYCSFTFSTPVHCLFDVSLGSSPAVTFNAQGQTK